MEPPPVAQADAPPVPSEGVKRGAEQGVHPFVRDCCERCQRGYGICWKGMCWCLAITGLIAPLVWGLSSPFGRSSVGTGCLTAGLLLTGAFAVCYVFLLLARMLLLTFFIAKFSLGQFLVVLMLAGLGVSLLIELEGGWKVVPAAGLTILFGIVGLYVKSYDPFTRNKLLPPAAREVLFHPPDVPARKDEG